MSNNLISLERYKLLKGINSTTEDAKLTQYISNASDYVKTYLGRSLNDYVDTAIVEYSRGNKPKYYLKEFPLIELVSVELESSEFPGVYNPLVENTDFFVDEDTDAIETISGSAITSQPKPKAVRITYKGGYQDIPGDLELAVMDLVTYYAKGEYVPNKQVGGTDSIAQAIPESRLPKHIARVLEMHRQSITF